MNLSPATQDALRLELQKLSDEIAQREEHKKAIEVLLEATPAPPPPFPYHETPPVAKPALRKISLTQELRVFLNSRPNAIFSVKNFQAHLENNFDPSQYNPRSPSTIMYLASVSGVLEIVKRGTPGGSGRNPTMYRVKGGTQP